MVRYGDAVLTCCLAVFVCVMPLSAMEINGNPPNAFMGFMLASVMSGMGWVVARVNLRKCTAAELARAATAALDAEETS